MNVSETENGTELPSDGTELPSEEQESLGKRLYTAREVAEYLGMKIGTVRHLYYDGKIPVVNNGRSVFLDKEDLDRWVEENKRREDLL